MLRFLLWKPLGWFQGCVNALIQGWLISLGHIVYLV